VDAHRADPRKLMKPSTALLASLGLAIAATAPLLTPGCAATKNTGGNGGDGAGNGTGAEGGGFLLGGFGTGGPGSGGSTTDPCGSMCGAEELCDTGHAGIDDDCDGVVDEGCPCNTGMVQSCFKGEPGYRNKPGCFPGTQHCSELGIWDECVGGVHATDHCYESGSDTGCHPLQSYPFLTVDLKTGTGVFSADATSETFTVDCPPGISPCPAVNGSSFQPLQSGEYTVHYTKQTATGSDQCSFPLFVGAPGLRVELEWEHNLGGTGVDVDLHLHKPGDTTPWGGNTGNAVDCAYSNCTVDAFEYGMAIDWFNGAAPPDPVAWYLDPVQEKNTCYYAPRGRGAQWQALGQGCHNPRLDLDNIDCDPAVSDVNDSTFCAPENVNIDFPPKGQWIRIGVDYYNNPMLTYAVHPRVRIFCNAALVAELGPQGYNTPVTFEAADGDGWGDGQNKFWMVADVRFAADDPCLLQNCEVVTLYQDANAKTAYFTTENQAMASFGPPYPP
jgi:hypothetical protein